MEIKELIELIARMRSEQKEYFTSRSRETLQRCKALERQVDEVVKRLSNEEKITHTQTELFK